MRVGLMIGMAAAVISGPALAQPYCQATSPNGRLYDGAALVHKGVVTQASARKPGATPWCSLTITTLGGVTRMQLVEKPKLGEAANPRRYVIAYRGNRSGQDTFLVRVFWRENTSKENSATIRFHVTVVDRPL